MHVYAFYFPLLEIFRSKKRKRKHSDADRESSDDERRTSNESSPSSAGHVNEAVVDKTKLVLDIKPLTGYVENRKELNDELFKIMGRKEMKKLMPKSVKVCSCIQCYLSAPYPGAR